MKHQIKSISPERVRRLHDLYGLDLLSAAIAERRGLSSSRDMKFLLESDLAYLHSPFLFEDCETAVERVLGAIEEGEKVCVFGDRDTDGITSTALIVRELRENGLDVSFYLPEGDSPYGLTLDVVDEIKNNDITLVITVDCGISNIEEIKKLNDSGIDTIVLDHHIEGEILPPAYAILDPKMETSGYPFSHLAGCGVAAKFIWALRFAKTDLYGSDVILLHCEMGPGENSTTIIQAIRLENMIEIDRLVEEVPNGMVEISRSRAIKFLNVNLPIIVWNKESELKQLHNAFGRKVDIALNEIGDDIAKMSPSLRGKSLLALSAKSRGAMYADGFKELSTLTSLFTTYCYFKHPSLLADYDKILDLVAIGTIGDLMPLNDENRILVKRGLKLLSTNPRKQLIELLSAQNLLGKSITCQDIGWQISPVFNASGRLGCPSVAVNLLLSDDGEEISKLTKELLKLNKERQKISEDAWNMVRPKAQASLEHFGSKFVLVEDERVPRGLTGILASRLLKEFSASPAAMVLTEAEDNRVSASIRSRETFHSRNFLSKFSHLVQDFGGHKCAGGFSMDKKNLSEFKKLLEDVVLEMDGEEEVDDTLALDAKIPPEYMNSDLIKIVELFEPYGEQNGPLNLYLEGGSVEEVASLGQDRNNLKLVIKFGNLRWPCVYWNGRLKTEGTIGQGDKVNMVFRLARNYFRGSDTIQLTIIDLEIREKELT